jgi:hypothetical protein
VGEEKENRGGEKKKTHGRMGYMGSNNLCMKKLERTASLVERGKEASGACGILGLQNPASSDLCCRVHEYVRR